MARLYRRRRGRTARTLTSGDESSPAPALPHERDESAEQAPPPVDAPQRGAIRQAYEDVRDGQVDTDARNRVAERLGELDDGAAGPHGPDPAEDRR